MEDNLLKTLRKSYKQPDLETIKNQINSNNKYTQWAVGDFNIYFTKSINFKNLNKFFKSYNYDVISEGNDTHIYIKSTNSNDYISTEFVVTGENYKKYLLDFEEDCKEEEQDNDENWIIELENMKKFDSYYMIKAHNETESKFIVLLALYILKEKDDVLVYDTFNGVYLNSKRLQALQELIIQQDKTIHSQKNSTNNNTIENTIVITLFLSGIFVIIFAFSKMIIPTIVSISTFLICSLMIAIIGKIKDKVKKNNKEISMQDRIKGSLYGFFVADALGVPVEFVSRDELGTRPVKDMLEYGTHNQTKGTWSDDSSMVLATIDSMHNNQEIFLSDKIINYNDLMDRFLDWKLKSDYTPHGKTFDIGNSTSDALLRYQNNKNNVFCGVDNINSNGNGSLMRILPISLYTYFCRYESYAGTLYDDNYDVIKNVSSLTHSHVLSVISCYIYSYLINNYLMTININKAYERTREHFKLIFEGKINKDYGNIIDNKKYFNRLIYNDISTLAKEDIKSSGFVIDTLEASIWCVLTSNSYKEAVLKAVNLGDDTDTVGALTGALAGLIYGINDIPTNWLNKLQRQDYLDEMVNKYLSLLELRNEKNKKDKEESILKYKEDLKKHRSIKANKDSWKNTPISSTVEELDINIILSKEDMELIKLGHIPYEMEDHWFMYVDEEEKTINYYRSWTGIQAYKAYYKEDEKVTIYKLIVNKDENAIRYRNKDTNTHIINSFKEHIQSEINCHKFND